MTTINRLTFLKTAGVAAGTAAISTSPALAAAIEPGTTETAGQAARSRTSRSSR